MSGIECYYCGLVHAKVEAGGVYYCPNRLCIGPGAWSHRKGLKSYQELTDGGYTVDPQDVLESVHANTNSDFAVWTAECKAVEKWIRRTIAPVSGDWMPQTPKGDS